MTTESQKNNDSKEKPTREYARTGSSSSDSADALLLAYLFRGVIPLLPVALCAGVVGGVIGAANNFSFGVHGRDLAHDSVMALKCQSLGDETESIFASNLLKVHDIKADIAKQGGIGGKFTTPGEQERDLMTVSNGGSSFADVMKSLITANLAVGKMYGMEGGFFKSVDMSSAGAGGTSVYEWENSYTKFTLGTNPKGYEFGGLEIHPRTSPDGKLYARVTHSSDSPDLNSENIIGEVLAQAALIAKQNNLKIAPSYVKYQLDKLNYNGANLEQFQKKADEMGFTQRVDMSRTATADTVRGL